MSGMLNFTFLLDKMNMIKGNKLICKETIKDKFMGNVLFEKDKVYEVLYVDNEKIVTEICLNHNLDIKYGGSYKYKTFPLEWVAKNFKIIKS